MPRFEGAVESNGANQDRGDRICNFLQLLDAVPNTLKAPSPFFDCNGRLNLSQSNRRSRLVFRRAETCNPDH